MRPLEYINDDEEDDKAGEEDAVQVDDEVKIVWLSMARYLTQTFFFFPIRMM